MALADQLVEFRFQRRDPHLQHPILLLTQIIPLLQPHQINIQALLIHFPPRGKPLPRRAHLPFKRCYWPIHLLLNNCLKNIIENLFIQFSFYYDVNGRNVELVRGRVGRPLESGEKRIMLISSFVWQAANHTPAFFLIFSFGFSKKVLANPAIVNRTPLTA